MNSNEIGAALPAEGATELQKARARGAVQTAIRAGRMVKGPCSYREGPLNDGRGEGPACGAEKVDAHHDDYGQPLDVRWLCRPHHRRVHAAVKTEPRAAAGATISWRRLRDSGGTFPEPVYVMVDRRITGVWIPAELLDPADLPGGLR